MKTNKEAERRFSSGSISRKGNKGSHKSSPDKCPNGPFGKIKISTKKNLKDCEINDEEDKSNSAHSNSIHKSHLNNSSSNSDPNGNNEKKISSSNSVDNSDNRRFPTFPAIEEESNSLKENSNKN